MNARYTLLYGQLSVNTALKRDVEGFSKKKYQRNMGCLLQPFDQYSFHDICDY